MAPYHVLVTQDAITLNDVEFESPEAFGEHLAQQLRNHPPLPRRRVFVRYRSNVPALVLKAVLDEIVKADGIIAWTQPDDGDWRGFWDPESPFRSRTENARATVYREKDTVRVLIASSAEEPGVVSFEIDVRRLGINAFAPNEIIIEHLDKLWQQSQVSVPENVDESLAAEDPDDIVGDLERAIAFDTEIEKAGLKEFEFDRTNFYYKDGVVHLLVEPMRVRALLIRRR